jgi:hypothetical protein
MTLTKKEMEKYIARYIRISNFKKGYKWISVGRIAAEFDLDLTKYEKRIMTKLLSEMPNLELWRKNTTGSLYRIKDS